MLFSSLVTSYILCLDTTPAFRLFFTFSLSFITLRTLCTAYSLGHSDCKDEMRDEMSRERSAYIRMMDTQIESERSQMRIESVMERQKEGERGEADRVLAEVWFVDE